VDIHVGRAREIPTAKPSPRPSGSIGVPGRVAVRGVNIDGDEQADRSAHGGPDKAVIGER
jgi:MOSC domain-containing protein YiiM